MTDHPKATMPSIDLHGLGPDIALLTAIDRALDVPVDELPSRVELVRGYLGYVLDTLPDTRRNSAFRVIAGMIARDTGREQS
jgi:hypothetical protein